jgi:hypothetical protein
MSHQWFDVTHPDQEGLERFVAERQSRLASDN